MDKQTLLVMLNLDIDATRAMQVKYAEQFTDAHDVWMNTIGPVYHRAIDRLLVQSYVCGLMYNWDLNCHIPEDVFNQEFDFREEHHMKSITLRMAPLAK
jgi:hypothetical protein